jgi:hypothetical protein
MINLTKLGKIKKPKISDFEESRKLFCIPIIPQLNKKDLTNDLKNSIKKFWIQVSLKIEELKKIGKVSFVFIESNTKDDKPGLEMSKKISEEFYQILNEKINKKAKIVAIEDEELFNEFLDWSLCLSIIRRSKKVFNKILEFYKDAKDKRNRAIAKKINQILKHNDCGLLLMTDENRLQIQPMLSSDIQVFLIHPPAYNDIIRSFRELMQKQRNQVKK